MTLTNKPRKKNPCRVVGCKRIGPGTICGMHRARLKSKGDVGTVEAGYELPTHSYRQAHARVTYSKGKASEQDCVDCGKAAREWSYMGGAPDELSQPWKLPHGVATVVRFSNLLEYYEARCKACHIKFDKNKEDVNYSCPVFRGE